MIGKHFAQQDDRSNVELLADAVVQVARASEVLHQAPADRVGVRTVRIRQIARKGLRLLRQGGRLLAGFGDLGVVLLQPVLDGGYIGNRATDAHQGVRRRTFLDP